MTIAIDAPPPLKPHIPAPLVPPSLPHRPKKNRWKEAIALLEEMIAGGPSGGPKIAPSVVSYNAAITACSRGDKMPAALRLLGEMSSRSGLKPDIYSYAAVMSGLAKARNPGRAARLLGEMRAAGVAPDLVCLASAMEACEKKGASKEAAEILEQVRRPCLFFRVGVSPVVCFASEVGPPGLDAFLVDGCRRTGRSRSLIGELRACFAVR